MTMISLILKGMQDLISIDWVAILYGSINIICMTMLHTAKAETMIRILSCMRRVTLFIFTHAVMRASMDPGTGNISDSGTMIIIFIKGFALLCALSLIPKIVTDEDDGESFSSQITYAYATNMGGLLNPLRSSRLFTLVTFMFIITSPYLHNHTQLKNKMTSQIMNNCLQAFDLVVFDAFTSQAFVNSGDQFCDLSIIIGSFSILWNFQNISTNMEGIQQFTTWRTAAFISEILNATNITGIKLSILMFLLGLIHAGFSKTSSIVNSTPWLQDLLFLVALNGVITDTQKYIVTIGAVDGIPILFGLVLTLTIVNDIATAYATRNKFS
jgi:hypothetical protein